MKLTVALMVISSVYGSELFALQNDASKPLGTSYAEIRETFAPLGEVFESPRNSVTESKVSLGRILFFDKRLSKDHDLSCNSCHSLDKYGIDHLPVSVGFAGKKGGRNAPTVYNAAGHLAQFWDGRAKDVEEQAKGPILNPIEMAMPSGKSVAATLKTIPGYVGAFQAAFPGQRDPVSIENAAKAIGAFERKLTTPSRWDDYLKGDQSALTAEEKAGMERFVTVGCPKCHSGELVGGQKFEKLGQSVPWPDQADRGRSKITKYNSDDMVFKVPSLRNIAETAPYFHNGSAATLEKAVGLMAKHQLGVMLTDSEIASIVTFLKSLTGTIPVDYIKEPQLP